MNSSPQLQRHVMVDGVATHPSPPQKRRARRPRIASMANSILAAHRHRGRLSIVYGTVFFLAWPQTSPKLTRSSFCAWRAAWVPFAMCNLLNMLLKRVHSLMCKVSAIASLHKPCAGLDIVAWRGVPQAIPSGSVARSSCKATRKAAKNARHSCPCISALHR